MPRSILNKVRNLVKKSPAAAKKTSKTELKSDAHSTKKKSVTEGATDNHTPEPLEKAKQVRAAEPEVWKPGTSGTSTSTKSKEGDRPRRTRKRKSQKDDQKPADDRAEKKDESQNSDTSKPRRGNRDSGPREMGPNERKSRESAKSYTPETEEAPEKKRAPRERSKPSGDRGKKSEGRRGSKDSGSTRGKGFSFPRPKPDAGDWTVDDYQVKEEEGKTRFVDLGIADELLHSISDLGYEYCTPIQGEILPALVEGRDGMGQAQTGTGKTAAFLLASLNHLVKNPKPDHPNGSPRMLILAPTRELVLQIEEEAAELMKYTNLQSLPVYGGLDYEPQKEALRHNQVDVVAATPGRLIDFMRSKVVDLSKVEILVLDEADRMLDMGFIPDVKRIVYATPHKDKRQTLFFSATFTDDIRRLAQSWTKDPISIVIEPKNVAADTVDQLPVKWFFRITIQCHVELGLIHNNTPPNWPLSSDHCSGF